MARLAFVLFLAATACAHADVIWLRNDPEVVKQVGNRLKAPLRLFEGKRGPGVMYYVRGRIVEVDPAEVGSERIQVVPWSRKSKGSREVVVGEPLWIAMKQVQDIEHEFDSYLDMEMMFSSRKNFASERWKERIRLLLDPKGELGLVAGSALPPAETAAELREVRLEGWLPFLLKELVATPPEEAMSDPVPKEGETHAEMLERMKGAEREDDLQRFQPAFHPVRQVQTAGKSVRTLLQGAALVGSHQKELEEELRRRYPDPADRSELDFATQCRFSAGFLCALGKVPAPPALDDEGVPLKYDIEGYTRRHYRQTGRAARSELIAILEEAVSGTSCRYDHFRSGAIEEVESKLGKLPDRVRGRVSRGFRSLLESKGGSRRLDPRSRLDATPSELALQAMRVIRNYPTWWVIQLNAEDPGEGVNPRWKKLADSGQLPPTAESDRLIQALIRLAQTRPGANGYPSAADDAPLPDPRRLDGEDLRDEVRMMAQATLVGLLLPTSPDAGSGGWRMPLDSLSTGMADMVAQSGRAFRMALEPLYYSENPAIQDVLTSPLINVVGRLDPFLFPEVLDNLFSTLNHETKQDPTASKFQIRRERARRAYAARLILILASQAGADDSLGLAEDRIQDFGNETVKRLLSLRISRAAGSISPGERRLDDAIRRTTKGGSPLGERARVAEEQIEIVRAKEEADLRDQRAAASEAVAAAEAALQSAPPDLSAIKRESLEVDVQRTRRERDAIELRLKHMLEAKPN